MKFIKHEIKSSEGGSDRYLKFQDGESKKVILRGEPYRFYQKWPAGGQKEVFTNPTPGASVRYRVNAVVLEAGQLKVKIWEFSQTTSNILFDINEKHPLEKNKIKITKMGKFFSILHEEELALNTQGALAKLDLHILDNKKPEPSLASNGWDGDPGPESELPF